MSIFQWGNEPYELGISLMCKTDTCLTGSGEAIAFIVKVKHSEQYFTVIITPW